MNKSEFLNRISNEERLTLSNLFDKVNLSMKIQKPVCTNEFYTPDICSNAVAMSDSLGVKASVYGIFEQSERNMMIFSDKAESYDLFPIKLIKIENKSKFNILQHKDYLGAIMALGIKRNKFGDLIVKDNSCYVAASEDIVSYISNNLDSIGSCTCNIYQLDAVEANIPKIQYEEFNIIVSSLRLDCLISSICNISRNKSVELINKGNVLLNYMIEKQKDCSVPYGTTLTIRGYGKFKMFSNEGVTAKNRVKVLMKKFI